MKQRKPRNRKIVYTSKEVAHALKYLAYCLGMTQRECLEAAIREYAAVRMSEEEAFSANHEKGKGEDGGPGGA